MSATALGALPASIRVCDVGPRDGLQNEAAIVSTEAKVRYIEMLAAAGLRAIEIAAFVHPARVPQMADAEAVLAGVRKRFDVEYQALVPNERGLERALAAGARSIVVFTAASESFAKANINMSIDDSLAVFARIVREARGADVTVKASISTAFGCPFEGAVPVASVVRVATALARIGVDEISIADTIGVGTPNQVADILAALDGRIGPSQRLSLHFHDTRGTALANVLAGLECGVTAFESSSGGLGGCPFAPGATGNLATEDLVYLAHGMGIDTGIDLTKLRDASRFVAAALGRRGLPSRAYTALEAVGA